MRCPSCGAEFSDSATMCSICGRSFEGPWTVQPWVTERRSALGATAVVLIILTALLSLAYMAHLAEISRPGTIYVEVYDTSLELPSSYTILADGEPVASGTVHPGQKIPHSINVDFPYGSREDRTVSLVIRSVSDNGSGEGCQQVTLGPGDQRWVALGA